MNSVPTNVYPEFTIAFNTALFSALGIRYSYGGSMAKNGMMDCSELVIDSLRKVGVGVPDATAETIYQQFTIPVPAVSTFFPILGFVKKSENAKAAHVVCFLSEDVFIHCAKDVGFVSLGHDKCYWDVKRELDPRFILMRLAASKAPQGMRR